MILQTEAHTRTGRRWAGLVTEWPDDAQKEKKKKKKKKNNDQDPLGHNDPSDEESTRSHEKVTKPVRVMQPSRLHMLSGDQQSKLFLRYIRDAASSTAAKLNALDEALQGPWRFEDEPTSDKGNGWDATSLGWYANQRGWAYSGTKPEDVSKKTVAGVAWLAAEDLASLPTWVGGKHLRTTAVSKETLLCPLWTVPLSLAAVEYLLRNISEEPDQTWYQRGVAAILKCEKGSISSKYYRAWFPPRVI